MPLCGIVFLLDRCLGVHTANKRQDGGNHRRQTSCAYMSEYPLKDNRMSAFGYERTFIVGRVNVCF